MACQIVFTLHVNRVNQHVRCCPDWDIVPRTASFHTSLKRWTAIQDLRAWESMKSRVTFMERTGASAEPSQFSPGDLAIEVPNGVVVDRAFVERAEPPAVHNTDECIPLGAE